MDTWTRCMRKAGWEWDALKSSCTHDDSHIVALQAPLFSSNKFASWIFLCGTHFPLPSYLLFSFSYVLFIHLGSRKSHLLFIHSSSVSSFFRYIYILFHFRLAFLHFTTYISLSDRSCYFSASNARRWSTTKAQKSVAAENECKLYLYFYDFICCQLSRRVFSLPFIFVCAHIPLRIRSYIFFNDACFVRCMCAMRDHCLHDRTRSACVCVWMGHVVCRTIHCSSSSFFSSAS